MQREFELRPYFINHQAKPGKQSWVKIFTYEPAEEGVLASRGRMYAILSVGAKVPLDFSPIMQLIMEALHKNYFEKTEGTILQTLESALDGIHRQLILMAQKDKRLSSGFSFNLLVAVSWGTTLYFGQLGASRASLMRKGMLYDIDEGEQKTTGLYLSSGQVKAGDRILLATQELVGGVDRSALVDRLGVAEEELVGQVEKAVMEGSGSDASKMSGIVLVVDIRQVPTAEEEGLRLGSADMAQAGPGSKKQSSLAVAGRKVRGLLEALWGWRIGKLPGLPVLLVVLAALALVLSMLLEEPELPREENSVALNSLRSAVTKHLTDAEAIASVNPDRAYDLVVEADGWLGQGFASYPEDQELKELSVRLQRMEDRVLLGKDLEVRRLATLEVKPTGRKLLVLDDRIVVLHSQQQRLAMVSLAGKVTYSDTSNRFSDNALVAATDDGLLLTESGQAYVVSEQGRIGSGRSLSGISQIEAIAGYSSNGYALSRAGQVLRIPISGSGVGSPSLYFNEPLKGNDYVDIAVDGSIYLLRQNGQVEAYRNRSKQNLVLERGSLLTKPEAILTGVEGDYLVVLQGGALWLWDKSGEYVGQRRLANGQAIEAVGVDEEGETVYILSNNGVYLAEL